MRLPETIRQNLHLLLAETSSQVGDLQSLLESSSQAMAQKILGRRGYSANLKQRIHDGCIEEVKNVREPDTLDSHSLRAAEAIASELERLTELVRDCVGHLMGTKRRRSFKALSSANLLDEVRGGIRLTRAGLEENRTESAVKLGEVARRVSAGYDAFYQQEADSIRTSKHSKDVVAALFFAQRLNEMGNILIEISEAILSARLGHPLDTDRFAFLQQAFADLGLDAADVKPLAETNSGSGVSGISDDSESAFYVAVFKDGERQKLNEERERVESWHELFPGLAPQILSYRQQGGKAALLIEHLPGYTFEKILLTGSEDLLTRSNKQLKKTLKAVWKETAVAEPSRPHYIQQLRDRLAGVQEIHAGFGRAAVSICGARVLSMDQLIDTVAEEEAQLVSPVSVYIHGDFNLDNIIFDPDERSIRFIDLHRSRHADFVQDVSVFMVSNYRLQALDVRTRRRIRWSAVKMYELAAKFARHHDDVDFERRLAVALARSFITSTRFILDNSLANAMWLRACYLLERLIASPKRSGAEFKLQIKELFL